MDQCIAKKRFKLPLHMNDSAANIASSRAGNVSHRPRRKRHCICTTRHSTVYKISTAVSAVLSTTELSCVRFRDRLWWSRRDHCGVRRLCGGVFPPFVMTSCGPSCRDNARLLCPISYQRRLELFVIASSSMWLLLVGLRSVARSLRLEPSSSYSRTKERRSHAITDRDAAHTSLDHDGGGVRWH